MGGGGGGQVLHLFIVHLDIVIDLTLTVLVTTIDALRHFETG